ncbi:unnamed protein product [Zymoseptoria tritici ST99CH_1E4]|uniref:Uncharacterized protein n=1 Tax=Zymoseptoria tritici ST99CH_1E4 TaxID=1276532 RepID=A0A2H1H4H5_ZYMTR|nr:unnamed protein product [Zymoseptoria tritici ST99CH_1E4]
MDVQHTAIDKESVRREAAVTPDLTHKNSSEPRDHMSTAAAPPPGSAIIAVSNQVSQRTSAPSASTAAIEDPATQDCSPQASFMGLPPELRLNIYEALWTPTKRKYTIHSDTPGSTLSDRVTEQLEEDKNKTRTALLRVNKHICQEATPVLHSTSDLTLKTTGRRHPRLSLGSITPGARTYATSIRVSMDVYELSAITKSLVPSHRFDRDLYPNVEMLQIFLDLLGGMSGVTWQDTAAIMFTFISEFAESPRLKSVAFELYSTPDFLGRRLYGASTDTLCGRLPRSMREKYGNKGGNSAAIDVLWKRRVAHSQSPASDARRMAFIVLLSITDEAQAIAVHQSPRASLKGIAPELRISIYEALWIPKARKYTIHTDNPERRVSQRQTKRSLDDIDRNRTALLQVDKQIYQEAVNVMHSNSELGLWCMYGRMQDDAGAVWPVLYKFPTSSASAHITSVTLQVVLRTFYSIAFAPQGYPSMEKLQLVIKHDGRWWNEPHPDEAASELVGKCSTNARLKTVAVELVVNRKYIAIHNDADQNRAAAEQACNKVQKELEADFRLMRKSVAVEVLWSQGTTPY